MSKLEELIAELCPDGVEYLEIPELFNTRNGYTPSKSNKEYWENGEVPWFRMEDIRQNGRILSKATQYVSKSAVKGKPFPKNSIIIATSATIGEHALITVPSLANQRFTYLMLKDEYKDLIDIKFVYYYCFKLDEYCKACLNQGNFASVDMNKFVKFRFPLLPLEVQTEIVRILDNFTELTAELIGELTAELATRKKQYEYYRDELFGRDYDEMIKRCLQNNVKIIALEELGKFTRGKRFVRDDIKEDGTPCIHYGDLYTYFGVSAEKTKCFLDKELAEKMRFAHKGDVVIVQAGENDMDIGIGVAWMGKEDVAVHDACYIFEHNINPKYISYYLRTNIYHLQIKKYVSTGKICSISSQGIGKALIPVPSIEEQGRIVGILDRFDVVFNHISTGLSAEIEARKKQYEYYRDKLLTFKELS